MQSLPRHAVPILLTAGGYILFGVLGCLSEPALAAMVLLTISLLGALLWIAVGARVSRDAPAETPKSSQANDFMHYLSRSKLLGVVIAGIHGEIFDASDAWLDMVGYTRDELRAGKFDWKTITPPEWAALDLRAAEEVMVHGFVEPWEKEYLRKDGTRVPVMVWVSRMEGTTDRFVAPAVDLSRIKQAEAQLANKTRELARYDVIVNSMPVAVFAKEYTEHKQGVYILANPKSSQLANTDVLVGRTDYEVFPQHAELVDLLQAHDREVMASAEPVVVDEWVMDAQTGKRVHLLSTKIRLLGPDGKPYGIAGIALDTTEQTLLTDRLRALVDAIPDVLFRMNSEGVCLDYQNNRREVLAVPDSELIGSRLDDPAFPPEFRERSMRAIRDAIETGEMQEIEYGLDTPAGVRHYEARVVKSGTDEAVCLVRDITEDRTTREALEATNAMLQRANDELKEFAYVASHDLQEPLRTVRSFTELLETRYADAFDEKGKKWLAFISDGTVRMRELINDLLDYSRVGRIAQVELVDTTALVRSILDDSRAGIEATSAEIHVGELPCVVANGTELRQVFQNLISNAIKFRRPQVAPRVHITARAMDSGGDGGDGGNGGWVFTVADNGIGIEPEYRERIFQVFQRLHGKDRYPGTGIGLALVKKIIEGFSGRISVRSTPGQGSEFQFTIPARTLPTSAET